MGDPGPSARATEVHAMAFEDSARRVGAYRFIEHRLFEITGGWAVGDGEPALAVHASEMSLQHAWHAELWEALLPAVAWADHDQLTTAPPQVAQLLDQLGRTEDPASRLAGLYRVLLPRLLTTYDEHAARTVPTTDGPVIRALTLVGRDEADQRAAGETLLAPLLDGGDARRRAEATAAELDRTVARFAGLWDPETGPMAGSVPGPGAPGA